MADKISVDLDDYAYDAVAYAERERCALVAEEIAREHDMALDTPAASEEMVERAKFAEAVAQAIRGRPDVKCWRPIETAPLDPTVMRGLFIGGGVWTTDIMWVRDATGRTFEAWYVTGRGYWWDADGECVCDPVEWMPHPLWTAGP